VGQTFLSGLSIPRPDKNVWPTRLGGSQAESKLSDLLDDSSRSKRKCTSCAHVWARHSCLASPFQGQTRMSGPHVLADRKRNQNFAISSTIRAAANVYALHASMCGPDIPVWPLHPTARQECLAHTSWRIANRVKT